MWTWAIAPRRPVAGPGSQSIFGCWGESAARIGDASNGSARTRNANPLRRMGGLRGNRALLRRLSECGASALGQGPSIGRPAIALDPDLVAGLASCWFDVTFRPPAPHRSMLER